jgi:phospholipid/cholesterol/gamma-HCH transport system substrate-binding protein
VVDTADTSTAATVEDSLASASLLVNGGSLGQVQTIVHELNTALEGRVDATRGVLHQTDEFLEQALVSTRQIDRSLRALADASEILDRRESTINRALREIRPAARSLDRSTEDLATLLRRTGDMAVTADRLVTRTRDDITLVVDELGPVLEKVLGIRDRLVPGLTTLTRFARRMDHASPTDYLNLQFLLHVDNPDLTDGGASDEDGGGALDLPLPGLPDLPVPQLPQLTLPPQLSAPGGTGGGGR